MERTKTNYNKKAAFDSTLIRSNSRCVITTDCGANGPVTVFLPACWLLLLLEPRELRPELPNNDSSTELMPSLIVRYLPSILTVQIDFFSNHCCPMIRRPSATAPRCGLTRTSTTFVDVFVICDGFSRGKWKKEVCDEGARKMRKCETVGITVKFS